MEDNNQVTSNIEDINEMSTNVEDLNDMQILSSSIEKDIDTNNIKKIISSDDLTKLQELQNQQLEQIKQMNELKDKMLEDSKENEAYESVSEKEDSFFLKVIKFIQDPLILYLIFFLVTYKPTLNFFSYIVPNLEGENIINIITRGTIFIIIYYILKFFLF